MNRTARVKVPADGVDRRGRPVDGPGLLRRYRQVRAFTTALCDGLEREDMVVQSMSDVSPTKWHLAHTSWFFETFVLAPHLPGYTAFDAAYAFLFNSYYVQAGERHCRAQRGLLSRPTVAEVLRYREHVDARMDRLLRSAAALAPAVHGLVELGLQHEQQHQELLLTDIKHVFSVNPLRPAYRARAGSGVRRSPAAHTDLRWIAFAEGLHEVGHEVGHEGAAFAFDNEGPRHREFLDAFELGSRLVSNAEYREFIEDGGYRRAELWLSLGWAAVQANEWSKPFYWERRDGEDMCFTLAGLQAIEPEAPVTHLSYFEADAYARWAGARLPSEAEWEVAARQLPMQGNFVESGALHPMAAPGAEGLQQMFGDVWEWTRSPYVAYPGFRPARGAVGEYNGKFMCNQFVLRGGSCVTPQSHIRPTYRNFFPPEATWQFTGLRLARDVR
ncbi:MAG: ergothioneine biosynthesis protein EgtB [Burkholderiales bacterium]|nr:ergothioneine biosynthesis protein EgtB [Burkholderiales bacterium]